MAKQIVESRGVVLESADSPTGFVLQIITPGIGSSGYYSAEVLESAVKENVFAAGMQLFVDHPSRSESEDRPERSIRDLAGSLTADATWNPISQAIEGPCTVYEHYGWIRNLVKDIGMSIRAAADVTEGVVIEGRKMPVIDKLVEAYSVDFVTKAGRGGKVLAAIESARPPIGNSTGPHLSFTTEATVDDRRDQLQRAVRDTYGAEGKYAWVRDYDPDKSTVYYGMDTPDGGGTFAQSFTVAADDLSVSLTGASEEVRVVTSYVPVTASGRATESEETQVPPVSESDLAEAIKRAEAAEAKATAAEAESNRLAAEKADRDNRDAAVKRVTERLGNRFDQMPTVRDRVIAEATRTLPVKDGVLDLTALEATADAMAEAETAYLKAALGSGSLSGHGQTQAVTIESTRTTNAWGRPIVKES